MEFDAWLAANGFDATAINEAQRRTLQSAWRADQRPKPADGKKDDDKPTPGTQTLDDILASARAENERCDRITTMVAQAISDNPRSVDVLDKIGRLAIEGKWDSQKTELAILREVRGRGPSTVASYTTPDMNAKVVEAAVCVAAGLENIEKHYDERTLDAAHTHYRGGLGLQDLLLTFARRNGYRGTSVRSDMKAVLRAAFREDDGDHHGMRAAVTGPSTYSLPNVFSNVSNKFLRAGFDAVDMAWKKIAAVRPVTDFKSITSVSLTGDNVFIVVPPSGEIKHGTLSENTFTNKADTYARMLGLDRRDIINDNLGVLASAGKRLGRGGALKLNEVFWATFLNNAAFFVAGNNNVSTGALSIASLGAADTVFRNQTDYDGQPTAIEPRILLVPTALRISAMTFMNSTMLAGSTTANTLLPDANPFAGAFEVVSSPYLSNPSFTGFSAAAWYLLASPDDMPVIEVVFLNGQMTPIVESTEAEFNMLGIAMRGFFDFGVARQEPRGGVRSTGV